ncbi:hypothetical protein FHX57_005034 [Paraburkholderia tropica]|uniref:hypothetical protein n=1 Tax=Paraburkholderia tropica TaxID=92647 RepID=UPI001609EBED|nr:hypothetical protein [Paraburkholderia tropica]MBB3002661.1 hypothetical protein [Paraburkholderia tropica]MBB6321982.1 hypothetical protein [Paraburkholderia tropica]
MADTAPVIFVEPVARGFRLNVLASAISAVRERSRRPVFIVTREDFACSELARRIAPTWTDVRFVASRLNFDGANTRVLGDDAAQALLDAAEDVLPDARSNQPADLVLLGADDYLDALAIRLDERGERFARTRRFVFLYNSDDFVAGELNGSASPHLGQNAIEAIEAMDATLLSFNERLRGECIGERAVRVLPDPWHGQFAPPQRKLAREAFKVGEDGLLVTADVDLLLDAGDLSWTPLIARLLELPGVRFALQGNVWALRNSPLRELIASLGERLVYAGMVRDAEQNSKLIAATDLLLSRRPQQHGSIRPARASVARRVRAESLGAAFDRDVMRWLVDSVDDLLSIAGVGMAVMRSELDRIAHERLTRAFGLQLRTALRRAH